MTLERIPGCTGKRKYATRELAMSINDNVRAKRQAKQMHAYVCSHCGCWHVSGQSPEEYARRMTAMVEHRTRVGRGA